MQRQVRAHGIARLAGVAILVAALATPARLGDVAAGGGGGSRAIAILRLACQVGTNLPIDRCVEADHESPPGVRTWSVTDPRSVSAGGGTMSGNPEFGFDETWVGDQLRSIRVRGHASVSQQGGGTATADAIFNTGIAGTASDLTVTGSVSFMATGSDLVIGSGNARVRLLCGDAGDIDIRAEGAAGSGEPPTFAESKPVNVTIPAGDDECDIEVAVSAGTGTNQTSSSEQAGSADAEVDVTFSFGPAEEPTSGTCTLGGTVDGITSGASGSTFPMRGIQVELLQRAADGGARLVDPVASDAEGDWCITVPAGFEPRDAALRATLVDAAHEPPLFAMFRKDVPGEISVAEDIDASDFGSADLELHFVETDERPWLDDVALIHHESERFLTWVVDVLEVTPATLGSVAIATGEEATSHNAISHRIRISLDDSFASAREDATSECPENCEWHELSHHVAQALGIADRAGHPACDEGSRVAHGGWLNSNTCDSLSEGFADFLSTLGSLDVDFGRAGYGTENYAAFYYLEDNQYKPWSSHVGASGTVYQREDRAVAQLLWDLVDAEPESALSVIAAAGTPAPNPNVVTVNEQVALGGRELVQLLAAIRPATVADVYDGLAASQLVPADLKQRDPTFPAGIEVTRLEAAFVLHGFHPVVDPWDPHIVGNPVGRTDFEPPSGGSSVVRRKSEPLPGSEIRIVNSGSGPATYAIDIVYPGATDHLEVVVQGGAERLVHVEVPPPWQVMTNAGGALPACGTEGLQVVTITITGPGAAPQSMDSCAYLTAVATTTTGYAMSYAAAGTGGGADMPLLVIGVVAAVALFLIGALLLSRRRKSSGIPPEAGAAG